MIDLENIFEPSAWEAAWEQMRPGQTLEAPHFLMLLEGESEDALESAFQDVAEKKLVLDLSGLPKTFGSGGQEARLRREDQLAHQGNMQDQLEENDPLRLYLQEVAALPAVAIEPEALAQRYLAGDEDAMEMLARLYLRQVVDTARKMTGYGVPLLDLIQEGSLGLWQGILEYTGGEFDAYVRYAINLAITKTVLRQARAEGVGKRLQEALEEFQAADKRLLGELGRNPTLEEIALDMGTNPEEAAVVREQLRTVQAAAKRSSPEPQEEAQAHVEQTDHFQRRWRIQEMLLELTPEEAELLRLRFGLEGDPPLSPQEAGKRLGLGEEEVLRREAVALRKLRNNRQEEQQNG